MFRMFDINERVRQSEDSKGLDLECEAEADTLFIYDQDPSSISVAFRGERGEGWHKRNSAGGLQQRTSRDGNGVGH